MNFDEAANAHLAWKGRLRSFIKGKGEPLDAATVSRDDQCPLGKWILTDGAKLSTVPGFQELRDEHTRFHKSVGGVLQVFKTEGPTAAEALLEPGSDFAKASMNVGKALAKMKENYPGG